MIDTTLLGSTEPISMDALYTKARAHFRDAWNQEMHKLAKKKSMMNFSQSHPIRHLEKREELLVAGTVMELMEDEAHCEMLLDLVFEAMQDQLHAALHEYAEQHGRDTDALTEEEIAAAVDQFANEFLSRMMNLLLRVQQVPEILQLSRSASAAEDLVKTRLRIFRRSLFLRLGNYCHPELIPNNKNVTLWSGVFCMPPLSKGVYNDIL